jgi:hypothetical protein
VQRENDKLEKKVAELKEKNARKADEVRSKIKKKLESDLRRNRELREKLELLKRESAVLGV